MNLFPGAHEAAVDHSLLHPQRQAPWLLAVITPSNFFNTLSDLVEFSRFFAQND